MELLSQRLGAEIATAKVMEKCCCLAGAILPECENSYVAADKMHRRSWKALNKIDLEISQVKLEMDMQKMLTSNTASVVISKINSTVKPMWEPWRKLRLTWIPDTT